jgi:zinc/manganese transport system permease protein
MTANWAFLELPFAEHALIAASLVAIISGVVGPFVISRGMSFAVHGAAELALTGAAAGLLIANNPVAGALLGSLVVASAFGILAVRDSAIGVILAFGLGLGFYLLEFYHGFTSEAVNILIGQITGVSTGQIELLSIVAVAVLAAMAFLYRPLTFASVDVDVAEARGVRTRLVGLLFLYLLCITVTEAAQVVGTILVLSLVITPAAAAQRLSARGGVVIALSTLFALIAADGGLVVNIVYVPDFRASSFITFIAFGIYVLARISTLLRRKIRLMLERRPVDIPASPAGAVALQDGPLRSKA